MFIQYLPCIKVLVKGNHDHKSRQWYYEHGWDFVCKQFYDVFFGKRVLFSHEPKQNQIRPDGTKMYDYNIHGHLHEDGHRDEEFEKFYDRSFNKLISIEDTGYRPLLLHNLIESYENKE